MQGLYGRQFVLLLASLFVALMVPVRAAGTLTVTSEDAGQGVLRYTLAWTSTAGGAVSTNTFLLAKGHLWQVKFVPGAGGTQPTDLYDVTLVDTDSVDLLGGTGANLSNASSTRLQFDPPLYQDQKQALDLVVANAGNAKTGTVYLWVATR